MSKTDYLEAAILNHTLRNIAYTPPATIYMGLFTSATSDAGGGTEVAGNGYARQVVTFGAPSGGSVSNTNTVTFPAGSPAGYGTITHAGYFDALAGGNMLRHSLLLTPRTFNAGDAPTFAPGQAIVTED